MNAIEVGWLIRLVGYGIATGIITRYAWEHKRSRLAWGGVLVGAMWIATTMGQLIVGFPGTPGWFVTSLLQASHGLTIGLIASAAWHARIAHAEHVKTLRVVERVLPNGGVPHIVQDRS